MRTLLLAIGSSLPIASSLTYIISIMRGKTRPQRMTNFLMVVITALMTLSLGASGDTSGVWLALVSCLQAVSIFILSIKYGIGGRERLDAICLALCLSGITLWLLSARPWVGLITSVMVDFIAVLPALRKTIRLPHTELVWFYALDTMAGLTIALAGPFTIRALLFPVYIALINFAFVAAVIWPRRRAEGYPELLY